MSKSSSKFVRVPIGLVLACMVGACQTGNKQSWSGAGKPGAKVNPTALQARAKAPPPSTATKKASIGKGKASVQTANTPGDTDSYWVEQIDIDGDGDVTEEQTELLWDDEDKVLFAYTETEVPCWKGGTALVSVLAGVNGKGNSRGRPEGSGFYALYFDAMECGAGEAGLYGCRFNAAGDVTAWAEAAVDSAGDEIVIVDGN